MESIESKIMNGCEAAIKAGFTIKKHSSLNFIKKTCCPMGAVLYSLVSVEDTPYYSWEKLVKHLNINHQQYCDFIFGFDGASIRAEHAEFFNLGRKLAKYFGQE
ncbi:MAG TPA: hypothetical protein VM577_08315 [Anaerovoracaceae bacterium]|nr:hypothetical protein [Anaerovoracaceae bacterium]